MNVYHFVCYVFFFLFSPNAKREKEREEEQEEAKEGLGELPLASGKVECDCRARKYRLPKPPMFRTTFTNGRIMTFC